MFPTNLSAKLARYALALTPINRRRAAWQAALNLGEVRLLETNASFSIRPWIQLGAGSDNCGKPVMCDYARLW